MQGAIDKVAVRFGDVVDAATTEISEIASEMKSFALSAVGLDDSEEDHEEPEVRQHIQTAATTSTAFSSASSKQISQFCQKYPSARVAPKVEELEQLWEKCSTMAPSAVASCLYEQLSYTDGEFEWQPRLRVLHVLSHFHGKGTVGKEIASSVAQQGGGLLQHLVQVQQCREKASRVVVLLLGKAAAIEAGVEFPLPPEKQEESADVAEAKAKAKPKPKPKPKAPEPDLMDFSEPSPPSAAPASTQKGGGADLDLMSMGGGPVIASGGLADLNLLCAPAAASAEPASTALADLNLLGAPAATSAAPVADAAFDPSAASAGNLGAGRGSSPYGQSGLGGGLGFGQPAGLAALGSQPAPVATGLAALGQASPYPSMSTASGMGAGACGQTSFGPGAQPSMASSGAGGWMGSSLAGQKLAPGPQMPQMPRSSPTTGVGGFPAMKGMGVTTAANFTWPPALGSNQSSKSPGGGGAKAAPKAYIPSAGELTPLHKDNSQDPFSFVNELTGLSK